MQLVNLRYVSGALLVAAFVTSLCGILLLTSRVLSRAVLESVFLASLVIAAIGVAVLAVVLQSTDGALWGRIAAMTFGMGTIVMLVSGVKSAPGRDGAGVLLPVANVLFVGAVACLGFSLNRSSVVPFWVGSSVIGLSIIWLPIIYFLNGSPFTVLTYIMTLGVVGLSLVPRAPWWTKQE